MNRFALTLILAAAPLLAVGMLAQSENIPGDSTNASSVSANSAAGKQFFRGSWLDSSNFTQDSAYFAKEFLGGGNFRSAYGRTESPSRRAASVLGNSGQNSQRAKQSSGISKSRNADAADQLAQFNAIYASLTQRGFAANGGVSPSVYRQLVNQQFAVRGNFNASARAHFTNASIAIGEKKSTNISAADLEMLQAMAQHTEHAADVRDVAAARLKKSTPQRAYVQRPEPPQRNHLSGQITPGQAEQNRRAALAAIQLAYAGTKVFAEVTQAENVRRVIQPESSSAAGCENLPADAKPADQIELKAKIGAPIK